MTSTNALQFRQSVISKAGDDRLSGGEIASIKQDLARLPAGERFLALNWLAGQPNGAALVKALTATAGTAPPADILVKGEAMRGSGQLLEAHIIEARYGDRIVDQDDTFVYLKDPDGKILKNVACHDQRDNASHYTYQKNVAVDDQDRSIVDRITGANTHKLVTDIVDGSDMCSLSGLASMLEAAGYPSTTPGQYEDQLLETSVSTLGKRPEHLFRPGTHEALVDHITGDKGNFVFTSVTGKSQAATNQAIMDLVDQGIPVSVGSATSGKGHVLLIIGYDDQGWIVHDPYGDKNLNRSNEKEDANGLSGRNGAAIHYPFNYQGIAANWFSYVKPKPAVADDGPQS